MMCDGVIPFDTGRDPETSLFLTLIPMALPYDASVADDLEAELFQFDLSSTCKKRSSMVPVAPIHQDCPPSDVKSKRTSCFLTPIKRIGNLTINTIRRTSLVINKRTPLKRVNSGTSPIKAPNIGARVEEDKENIHPSKAGRREYRFGDLHSSPVFSLNKDTFQPIEKSKLSQETNIDLDELESMIRNSSSHGNLCIPEPNQILFQGKDFSIFNEADELESLLFSHDTAAQDVFLYDSHEPSDLDTMSMMMRTAPPSSCARARSSSMIRVHSLKSTRPKPKIEVMVRSCKKELPILKPSSQLRKMVLPGDTPTKEKSNLKGEEEDDSCEEYMSFVDKIQKDEPVESSGEDDEEFKIQPDEEQHDDEAEPNIPQREIEFLFEDSNNMIIPNVNVASIMLRREDRDLPNLDSLVDTFRQHLAQHFRLLVQMLGLTGEVVGLDEKSIVMLKLLSQLKAQFPEDLSPPGIQNFESLLQTIPDPRIRSQLVNVQKSDIMLRPRTSFKLLSPLVFRHATSESPFQLSQSYYDTLILFGFDDDDPQLSPNFESRQLVDNQKVTESDDKRPRTRSAGFLRCEDRLLLVGLKKFGLGNWALIHAQFLPTRSSKQIAVRYKNLISRREPSNPVKSFVQELWQPLSLAEEELIYRGVQRFGKDFKSISTHFLPHRPPTILKKLWDQMDTARRQLTEQEQ